MTSEKKPRATIAAVEGGGTTFRVAVCTVHPTKANQGAPTVLARTEIDSSHDNPGQTLQACVDFLLAHKPAKGYAALGLATFGPVGVHAHDKATYGCILPTTPKAAWRGVDLLTPLRTACQGPSGALAVLVDTDVNAPALGEYLHEIQQGKASRPLTSLSYITVGTGIGVGLVVNGQCVHGRMHPEGGHVPVQPLPQDAFAGYSWGVAHSPFGGRHTVEGLASSVALTERWQQMTGASSAAVDRSVLQDLPDQHELWEHAANALANLCASLLLTLSMEKIVLGGGLMKRKILLDKIRQRTRVLLNGYLGDWTEDDMRQMIVLSRHGDDAGLQGAMVLAEQALHGDLATAAAEKKMKQVAFGHGLWHGMIVGTVATALVVKYVLWPRGPRR
jgi:fructokinase